MEKETYLTFVLDKDLFAVNVTNVLEVLEQQQITRVPTAPPYIMGITNFRGEILPVFSTRHKFNLPIKDELGKQYVIVYDISQGEQSLLVSATADGVKDVIEIGADEIKPVPEMGLNYDSRFISGVIEKNGKFILIIKPEKHFTTADIEQNESINAQENTTKLLQ
jgi:purine-binding chemotaxis protein CheW